MKLVLHLMRHDLRTHRVEVMVWLVLLAAHVPLGAAVIAGTLPIHPEVATPTLLLVRLALAAIIIASILQADAPSDDRTFWRTRPVPRAGLTVAKIGLIAALFLVAPLVLVLLEAMWLRLPLSHVPAIVFDVLAQDGALVGLMVLVATLTRRVASMVLAVVATGVGLFFLLLLAGVVLRSAAVRRVYEAAPQKADDVLPALGMLLAFATWTMASYAWRQPAQRRGLAVLGVAGMIAAIAVLAVPSLHASHDADRVVGRSARIAGGTLIARKPAAGGAVRLFAPLELDAVSPQADGTVSVYGGVLIVQERRLPIGASLMGYTPLDREVLVASLAPEEFAALAGRVVRVTGTVDADVTESGHLGRLPLRRGAVLEVEGLRLEVLEGVPTGSSITGRVAVVWTRQLLANFSWSQTELFSRSVERSAPARVSASPTYVTRSLDGAMLPTLAMPFGYREVTLANTAAAVGMPRQSAEPWLDVQGPIRRTHGAWTLDATVSIPTAPEVSRPIPERLLRMLPPR